MTPGLQDSEGEMMNKNKYNLIFRYDNIPYLAIDRNLFLIFVFLFWLLPLMAIAYVIAQMFGILKTEWITKEKYHREKMEYYRGEK